MALKKEQSQAPKKGEERQESYWTEFVFAVLVLAVLYGLIAAGYAAFAG